MFLLLLRMLMLKMRIRSCWRAAPQGAGRTVFSESRREEDKVREEGRCLSLLIDLFALFSANSSLSRHPVAQSLPDRRTSGSAPCSRGAEEWIERVLDTEEEMKDDELHDDDDDQRLPTNSLDSAVVLPLVDATSEFLAVVVRGR